LVKSTHVVMDSNKPHANSHLQVWSILHIGNELGCLELISIFFSFESKSFWLESYNDVRINFWWCGADLKWRHANLANFWHLLPLSRVWYCCHKILDPRYQFLTVFVNLLWRKIMVSSVLTLKVWGKQMPSRRHVRSD
jgi:hypothetical protein